MKITRLGTKKFLPAILFTAGVFGTPLILTTSAASPAPKGHPVPPPPTTKSTTLPCTKPTTQATTTSTTKPTTNPTTKPTTCPTTKPTIKPTFEDEEPPAPSIKPGNSPIGG